MLHRIAAEGRAAEPRRKIATEPRRTRRATEHGARRAPLGSPRRHGEHGELLRDRHGGTESTESSLGSPPRHRGNRGMRRGEIANDIIRRMAIRVMHFGLGPIGAAVVQQVATRRGFKVVGGIDIDPAKVGKDLGAVTGLTTKLGVRSPPTRARRSGRQSRMSTSSCWRSCAGSAAGTRTRRGCSF